MKRNHFRHILLCLCLLAGISASAYVEVGGIYYELGGKEATVTSGSTKYSGLVTIPASFTFKGKTYKVTAIGDNAFYYCYDLTGVTIPKGVKTIGDDAFYNCDGLTAITIPEGVTTIGPYAFDDCDGLTAITIPEGVTTIGTYAFYSCNRLASITFPESVTNIGAWAFYETSWYSNQPNGLIYAGKVAYKYKGTIPEGTEIVIEDGTKGIADTAFGSSWSGSGNSSLTSVVIAETVTNIGEYAFGYCSALSSITIPESVTSIGGYAFAGTAWYTNQPDGMVYAGKVAYQYKGTMPSGTQITLKEGTKGIAGRAFYYSYGGSSLTDIYIPSSVTNIGDYAFYRCDGLTSISIPNSVTSIGKYAFYQCSYLQSILIPASVASIGNGAFRRCNKARSITVSEDNPKYDSRGGSNAIIETATNKLLVGNAYTTIPNTVESIGAEAFFGCSGLYDIAIPGSVTSIGDNAFNECYDLSSVTISNGVTSIGDYAFSSTGLASVTIPASVAYIGTGVFSYCDLVTLKVNGGNPYYDSRDGCNAIIEKATNTLIAGSSSSTVPKGVTAIGDYAFSNCTGLSILDIPEGVTYIGQQAFRGCSRLYSITIPEGVEGINYYYCCPLKLFGQL